MLLKYRTISYKLPLFLTRKIGCTGIKNLLNGGAEVQELGVVQLEVGSHDAFGVARPWTGTRQILCKA